MARRRHWPASERKTPSSGSCVTHRPKQIRSPPDPPAVARHEVYLFPCLCQTGRVRLLVALAFAWLASLVACERAPNRTPPATVAADPAPAPVQHQAADAATTPSAPPPAAVESPPDKPSPGPAPLARTGTAGDVEYLELVVGNDNIDAVLPMVVALHGLGDQPQQFAALLSGLGMPARLVFPRALDPYEHGGFSWFPRRARDPDVDALAEGMTRATHALADAVREVVRQRPTQGRPVLTGFSQGGMLSFALATSHPDLFSAAFPVGGWLPPPLWPLHIDDPRDFPPIVALHGDQDHAVALGPTQAAVTELIRLGFRAQLHVYPDVGHAITPAMREELLALIRTELGQQ
ncbi:MAG: hypothetical protein B7733_04965 [Myxococcales bacterium FL481]|nr:MAG: hypothetical protein B7733_04965 [Myxococcales bacterium FL481]